MFATVQLSSWSDAQHFARTLPRWAFRGLPSATYELQTSIERLAVLRGLPSTHLANRERWILKQFQRRAHTLVSDPPSKDARLEWLALIQHYGGPTRLLDFTHSFYVACFFAIETAVGDAAVWAVDLGFLDERAGYSAGHATTDEVNQRYVAQVEAILNGEQTEAGVLHVEPERLNERMAIQKGLFLFPTDISRRFVQNLSASIRMNVGRKRPLSPGAFFDVAYTPGAYRVAKIILPQVIHSEAIDDLANMNIDATTLFPGLEGFARSLGRYVRH